MLTVLLASASETANVASNQSDGSGSGFLILLVLGGIAWFLYAIFSPKKAKYRVERETRVSRVK